MGKTKKAPNRKAATSFHFVWILESCAHVVSNHLECEYVFRMSNFQHSVFHSKDSPKRQINRGRLYYWIFSSSFVWNSLIFLWAACHLFYIWRSKTQKFEYPVFWSTLFPFIGGSSVNISRMLVIVVNLFPPPICSISNFGSISSPIYSWCLHLFSW